MTIESIIEAARQSGRNLTTNQAESILRRHNQLVSESKPKTPDRQKQHEMDDDWNWWYGLGEYEQE